jgi:hypothetical protein
MIVREGLYQDFPFADLVWKFIAGQQLTPDDVFSADSALREEFGRLRSGDKATWTFVTWDGNTAGMGPRPGSPVEDIENYIEQYLNERLHTLEPFLCEIRKGFWENIGLDGHPMLTGKVLERLVCGNPQITVDQLISLTIAGTFSGGLNNEYVQRMFAALRRFTVEELRLFLGFVTGLKRIPSRQIKPDFRITVLPFTRHSSDSPLPLAHTCFFTIDLPLYSSDDIAVRQLRTAVTLCNTMEMG